jgi:RNA polymerase sigma factor (sigma-70 family)
LEQKVYTLVSANRKEHTILSTVPHITAEEEAALAARWPDIGATNRLIMSHHGHIKMIVRALYPTVADDVRDDLESEAFIAAHKAVGKFNPARGRFSSILRYAIREGLRDYRKAEEANGVAELGPLYYAEPRTCPRCSGRLARTSSLLHCKKCGHVVQHQRVPKIAFVGEGEADSVEDTRAPSTDPDDAVEAALSRIAPKQLSVMRRRLLGQTQREIGRKLGVTSQRISQIEEEAKAALAATPEVATIGLYHTPPVGRGGVEIVFGDGATTYLPWAFWSEYQAARRERCHVRVCTHVKSKYVEKHRKCQFAMVTAWPPKILTAPRTNQPKWVGNVDDQDDILLEK